MCLKKNSTNVQLNCNNFNVFRIYSEFEFTSKRSNINNNNQKKLLNILNITYFKIFMSIKIEYFVI